MQPERIPYRQIHLDFHTSKHIEGVGEQFDESEFIQTLEAAHVNSINLFTKCHHGMYYYPTKIGTMHPSLKFDLFGAQVKACREHGIRAVAYTCVAWNEDWADRHPEWLVVDYNGVVGNVAPFYEGPTRWRSLCIGNRDYRALLKEEMREVYGLYRPDGFWIDIVLGRTCICPACQRSMREKGLDPRNLEHVRRHDMLMEIDFCRDFYGYLMDMDPSLQAYFNTHPYKLDDGIDREVSSAEKRKYFSFIDIESLPSEDWGYAHFPVAVNYVGHEPLEVTMMNGKFHGSWGDFGSLRNLEALEYECFRAVAGGAKVCVGDQLHPSGRLEPAVYERIGRVFESIELKEPWLKGSRKLREVAVLVPSAAMEGSANQGGVVEEGVYRALSELHIPFDFVGADQDLSPYALVILPDRVRPNETLTARLNAFAARGGKILATGKSGLMAGEDRFALDGIGCEYLGPSEYDTDYLRFQDGCFSALLQMDHVLYLKGEAVRLAGGRMLAETVHPYFNRTYDRYCSHRQTPPRPEGSGAPAIVEGEGVIYAASPLFEAYARRGYRVYRDILGALIARLLPRPLVASDLPALTELTLRELPDSVAVHLISYVISRRCRALDTIEARYTVPSGEVRVRTDFEPKSVRLVPEGTPLNFMWEDGYAVVPLENISGHAMIEISK
jgi:hypothetical protein